MALASNTGIDDFEGSQTSVASTPGSIADGAFVDAGVSWANTENAREVGAVLICAFATAPDANSSVDVYARPNGVDGANNSPDPSANYRHYHVASIPLKDTTSTQYLPFLMVLPNLESSQSYNFFVNNNGGQTMSASWDIKIQEKGPAPKA